MVQLGLKTLKKLCAEQNTILWHKSKLEPALFKAAELPVFAWVQEHVQKHHALPHVETLEGVFPEVIAISCAEPPSYYLRLLENSYFYDVIDKANKDSQQVIKDDQNAYEPAISILQTAIAAIKHQQYRTKITNVGKEGPQMVINAYHKTNASDFKCEFGWGFIDAQSGGIMEEDIISFIGRPAMGKAQPLTSQVLTPTGFKLMRDMKVGDKLTSVDGQESEVLAIHPQGYKPTYRLHFQDDRSVEASADHLWEVFYREWFTPAVLTTVQLIALLSKQRYQGRLSIRLFSGHWGEEKSFQLHPYALGALIGDGCFVAKDPRFSSADENIVTLLSLYLARVGCKVTFIKNYDFSVSSPGYTKNQLKLILKHYGLWGKKSEAKFIPEEYMQACRGQRVELLRGLFDTDGTVGKTGTVQYSSSSKKLAEQVQELIRSIGGKARIYLKKTKCLDNYIVTAVLADRKEVFHLERKKALAVKKTRHTNHRLVLTHIEQVQNQECQCLAVSHPSKLYVTDDFVVTHNTWKLLKTGIHNWKVLKNNVLFVSMEMGALPITQRISAMYAGTNISQLKLSGYASPTYKKFVDGLKQMVTEEGDFYVVDGNLAASVEDIYTLAVQLQCKVILVDGAYLLRHKNAKLDRFTRAAENVELMKRYGAETQSATIASWQFNRGATKKKGKDEEVGVEDIGYTDAIGQISSIVLGLFQDDGVETMQKRIIRILKGRNGEIGQFEIQWDFQRMVFDQIPPVSKQLLTNL